MEVHTCNACICLRKIAKFKVNLNYVARFCHPNTWQILSSFSSCSSEVVTLTTRLTTGLGPVDTDETICQMLKDTKRKKKKGTDTQRKETLRLWRSWKKCQALGAVQKQRKFWKVSTADVIFEALLNLNSQLAASWEGLTLWLWDSYELESH